jgi:hypothetical protein
VFNLAKDVIGDRRHRLAAKTLQRIMVLKDSISHEIDQDSEGSPEPDSDDDQAPYEEVTDIQDLHNLDRPRVGFDDQSSSFHEDVNEGSISPTPIWANDSTSSQDIGPTLRPPRVRKRPARFLE